MTVLEEQGQLMFARLNELKEEYEDDLEKLNHKKELLNDAKDIKRKKSKELKQQKKSKDELVAVTKGKEDKYAELIEEAREEQERINEQLEGIKDQLKDFESEQKALEIEENYLKFGDKLGKISEIGLSWPVDPAKGITAFFKDPSYKKSLGVNHYAIDVRASTNTPIMAAEDAYVFKVADNGYGYNYIVLLHTMEMATVYGHVTEFNVEEGDFVPRGHIIGYTGGKPGTKGAGLLTTGPHLHFEVRIDGKAKDPMDYLP